MKETVFVIMAKQPQVGKTKTRLYPALTPEEAIALSEAMILDTIEMAAALAEADLAVAITPPAARRYFKAITPLGTHLLPVEGEGMGDCLSQAIQEALRLGYRKVLALNSDGPTLPGEYLKQAALYLDQVELVLGPGYDGGYYLVGMKHMHAGIFDGISWSTDRVLSQTLERAQNAGLRAALTPPWYDVDTPDDLRRLQGDLAQLPVERAVHTRRCLSDLHLKSRLG